MVDAELLLEVYRRMLERLGRQHWWPADTPFEVCVGAILTQNTNWRNVEKAISNLKDSGLLRPDAIASIKEERLQELIRPSGFYRQKAKRLKRFCEWLVGVGGIDSLREWETERLREELLSIPGIGPETADSILLYAFDRPVFVVDAYTYRIFVRHGLVDEDVGYDELQELFMRNLPPDVDMFKEYHALLVEVGKRFCKRRKPDCGGCPLEGIDSLL